MTPEQQDIIVVWQAIGISVGILTYLIICCVIVDYITEDFDKAIVLTCIFMFSPFLIYLIIETLKVF